MIQAIELKKLIDFAYRAYQEHNSSGQTYRQNGKIPYLVHPLWCAVLLVTDIKIPYKKREKGFKALILHDILEDTSLPVPRWIEPEVKKIVQKMTFKSWEQAINEIPKRDSFVKLLILVDALSSMYENHVSERKRKIWKKMTQKLLKEVKKNYGNIRIIQIGKAIVENTPW